jgi:uncharacterized protein
MPYSHYYTKFGMALQRETMMKQDTYFTVDDQRLKATLFYPDKMNSQNPGVLFIHGWASSEENYARRTKPLTESGGICLTFDLRGHGHSEGDFEAFSRADHLKDVLAAYDFLASQQGVDPDRIGVCGTSYGGYLASILSSKRKVKWLTLRAPALYKNDNFTVPTAKIIEEDPSVFGQSGIKPQDNYALQAVSQFKNSILFIESEKDEQIPHATIENYLASIKKTTPLTYIIIKEADHKLSEEEWQLEFIRLIADWFGTNFSDPQ